MKTMFIVFAVISGYSTPPVPDATFATLTKCEAAREIKEQEFKSVITSKYVDIQIFCE